MAFKLKSYRFAFTLAEVLITLGIIGVVAALTIPIVINSYQKSEYVTNLKKAYTQFNQAMISLASDSNCVGDLKCTGLFTSSSSSAQPFGDGVTKYLKVLKNCSINDGQGCMSTKINANFDGSSATNYDWDNQGNDRNYRFITTDGIAFQIYNRATDCASLGAAGGVYAQMSSQTCGLLNIDANGPNHGPNFFGRDIFQFYITNGTGPILCPVGLNGWGGGWWYPNGCSSAGNKSGYYCSGRVVEQGWKIDY